VLNFRRNTFINEISLGAKTQCKPRICSCLATRMQVKIITNVPNTSFENVIRIKHFGTAVTSQNYIHEEIKGLLQFISEYYVFPHFT
jgi:hypothetical protein